ncbi:putative divalent cation/proton antiporter TMEM165 isoform X2 [Brevipalpus obovatus]
MVIVSELGDKTFFISAIMAMRNNRLTVFLAANSALVLMTVLSVCLGMATSIIPQNFIHYISTILFLAFGIKMLFDALKMADDEGKEEFEEVQNTLSKKNLAESTSPAGDAEFNGSVVTPSSEDPETGIIRSAGSASFGTLIKRRFMHIFSLVFIETFTMTLVAEWGDRSQITTIVLAARESSLGVMLGASLGHAMCNAIAVLGGRIVATMISVRTVTLIGGVIFVIFAFTSAVLGQ